MPYATQLKILGLGKETTRGQAAAPTKYIPIEVASEFDYRLALIEDENIRGLLEKFPPVPGIKEGTATIRFDVDSKNIGDFLLSLLGSVTSQQQNSGTAYKHTFKRSSGIQLPSYTLYMERQIDRRRYPLSVVKSIIFTGSMDGKLLAENAVLFKTEETTTEAMSPTWVDPTPFVFHQTSVKIDTVLSADVRDWSLTIDNQAVAKRGLTQSQDLADILSVAPLLLSGAMTVFLESGTNTQRGKFISGSEASLEIELQGALIEGSYYNKLKIILPRVHYTAFPYGETDGILTCAVTFNSYYKITSAYSIQIELTNTLASY